METTQNVSDILRSAVRTAVPLLVGAVVSFLAQRGVHVNSTMTTLGISLGTAEGYYLLGRLGEVLVSHKLGWLLGIPGAPSYAPKTPVEAPTDVPVAPAVDTPPPVPAPVGAPDGWTQVTPVVETPPVPSADQINLLPPDGFCDD
jgi:hypothetical protein